MEDEEEEKKKIYMRVGEKNLIQGEEVLVLGHKRTTHT